MSLRALQLKAAASGESAGFAACGCKARRLTNKSLRAAQRRGFKENRPSGYIRTLFKQYMQNVLSCDLFVRRSILECTGNFGKDINYSIYFTSLFCMHNVG